MSPRTLIIAAAAVAVSAFAVPALAQDAAAPPPPPAPGAPPSAPQADRPTPLRVQILFNLVDVNADGSIDQTEITALQKAIFVAVDTDKDGKITEVEFRKIVGGGDRMRQARMMHRGGPDGGQFMHRHGPRGPNGGPGDDRRGGPGRQGQLEQPGEGPAMMPGMPQMGDNGDNADDAFAGGAPRDFASLDANGDGTVSPEEFAAGAPMLPSLAQ